MSDVSPVEDPGSKMGMAPSSVSLYTLAPLLKKIKFESPQVAAVSRFRSNATRDEDVETFYRVTVFIPALDAINWT